MISMQKTAAKNNYSQQAPSNFSTTHNILKMEENYSRAQTIHTCAQSHDSSISHKLHDKTKQKPTTDCFCARLQQTMHQCKVRIRYGNQVSQLMCNERRNLLHKGFSWCSLLSSKLIAGLSLSVILDCSEVRQSSSLVYLPIDFLLQEQSWAAQQELLKSALDRKIRGTNVGRQISSFMPQSSICTTAEVASKK